jgi:hypothetical protein
MGKDGKGLSASGKETLFSKGGFSDEKAIGDIIRVVYGCFPLGNGLGSRTKLQERHALTVHRP